MKIPRLPFDFSGIFSFSRREITITVASVSAALILAIVITVIVISVKNGRNAPTEDVFSERVYTEEYVPAGERPFLSDFIINEDIMRESFAGVIYSRPEKSSWSDEEIKRYWIEPEDIAVEHLERDAEKIIRDIFADVP